MKTIQYRHRDGNWYPCEGVALKGYRHLALAREIPADGSKPKPHGWGVTHLPTGYAAVPMIWSRNAALRIMRALVTACPWIDGPESDPDKLAPSAAEGERASAARRSEEAAILREEYERRERAAQKAADTRRRNRVARRTGYTYSETVALACAADVLLNGHGG